MKRSKTLIYSEVRWFFRLLFIILTLAISLFGEIACASETNFASQYTSLKDEDCFELPRSMTAYYDQRQLDADECPAPKGWRLFRVFSMESFWIDIAHGDSSWSTEKYVMKDHGLDSPTKRPDVVEWRFNKAGEQTALIFRSTARDRETDKVIPKLFIFSFRGNTPCFSGAAKTNEKARKIADEAIKCNTMFTYKFDNTVKGNHPDDAAFISKYTSILDRNCSNVASGLRISLGYDSLIECPAPKKWRLFKVYDQEGRSWFNIGHAGNIWDTVEIVWGDEKYEIGHFPGIDSQRVEWRLSNTGVPVAMIFRVVAQNKEQANLGVSRLFVIGLKGKSPGFCGMYEHNLAAINIADKAENCNTPLHKNLFKHE